MTEFLHRLAAHDPLAGYPLWVEIAAGIVAGALAIWLLRKLLVIGIWLLAIAIVVGGIWFLLHRG